jgi:acid phosphatase
MNSNVRLVILMAFAVLSACTPSQGDSESSPDHAILWAAHSAEYQAISTQVYAQAKRDLPRFVADKSWSALPRHDGLSDKPPAIILDIDETVASGVDMELTLVPFTTERQYRWGLTHTTIPIRGVAEFVNAAKDLGVEVFFVTNRPCEAIEGIDESCIQDQAVVNLVAEIGIETDTEHVLLANERPDWGKEKQSRRDHVAKTHRVIMLVGDDYGDFVFCSRAKPVAPCTVAATRESRAEALETYKDYWGNGWYILPNPMHGSWTSVE